MAFDRLQKQGPWIVLGAILFLLSAAWFYQSQMGKQRAQALFETDAAHTEKALAAQLDGYVSVLQKASVYVTAHRPEQSAWRHYVNTLNLEQTVPAIYGLGFATYLTEDNRGSYGKITPRGRRFDYFVVQEIEPLEPNARLVGYDLGSDLSARTSADHARETQTAAITGKLILPDDPDHHALLLFYPVFKQDVLQGWVFARFREDDFLNGFKIPGTEPITLQVYDGPAMTRDALLFDSSPQPKTLQKPNEEPLTLVKGFQAPGRSWTLNFTAPAAAISVTKSEGNTGVPLYIVLGLLAIAGALAWTFMRRRAVVLAQHLGEGMRLREKALTLGPNGIIIANATEPDLPVVYVNRAFEKITGYSAQEVIGKNCRFLAGTDRDQKGLQDIRRALREQRDCRVLLRNYRKDGSPFWNDLFLSPVRNDMGRVVEYVAIQQDATDREQTTRRLATEGAIIRALAESPSLFEAAPRILKAICEGQEWDFGTFWRVDKMTHVLQCVDQWHPAELDLQDFENFIRETTFSRDMGVPGHIWAKGEQLWLPDLTKEMRFPESSLAVQAGLVSACGFPIASRRGLQGVLVFYSRRIWPLSKNLLLLMVGTGAQISQYMEREVVEIEQKELTLLERGLAEFMGEGLLAIDREGSCIYANATAGRMLGYHPRILLGQNAHEFLHPAGSAARCEASLCPLLLSLHSTRAEYIDNREAVFMCKDRIPLPVAYTTSPIIHENLIQGVVVTFVDASARWAEEDRLRKALEEKENEIKHIQQMLSQTRQVKSEPNPSDLLLEKIKKLLG